MTIAKEIIKIRTKLSIDADSFAKELGVELKQYKAWEDGRIRPSYRSFKKIIDYAQLNPFKYLKYYESEIRIAMCREIEDMFEKYEQSLFLEKYNTSDEMKRNILRLAKKGVSFEIEKKKK